MIGFAGLSHLGIVWSVAAASKGFEVVAYDPDRSLCAALDCQRLPIVEPRLADLLAAAQPRIRFSPDPAPLGQCEVIFLSMDVPTGNDGQSQLSSLHGLLDGVVDIAAPGTVLVVLSQVPPGFTRQVAARHDRMRRDEALFCQVETLVVGRAVERALHPEQFIVGCADPRLALPATYAEVLNAFGCPVLRMRYESAELAKVAINLLLVSSISTTNMLAEVCEAIGADWAEMAPALRHDQRIGPHAYLSPGLGIAGGNLERDLATFKALAVECGADAGLVEAWLDNSRSRRDWVLKILHTEVISHTNDPVIALWGLAYKPNTASTKNAPSLGLIEALRPFPLHAYDPEAHLDSTRFPGVQRHEHALDASRGADALAVMTPWPEFSVVDLRELRQHMRGRVIVDPFGALDGRACRELGFAYFCLGTPSAVPALSAC